MSSRSVNSYLSGILPGLSAKVFRTHHATEAVCQSLTDCGVTPDDPEYKKREAAVLANLAAAVLCNHTKKEPSNWRGRLAYLREQRDRAAARVARAQAKVEETKAKLFSPFFSTKAVGMGTGLGLAVSHGIVKMHKGQISAESNADREAGPTGTTFTVTLPRHEEGRRE